MNARNTDCFNSTMCEFCLGESMCHIFNILTKSTCSLNVRPKCHRNKAKV